LQRDIPVRFRQRQHGDTTIVGIGARNQLVGRAQPLVPGRRRGPAVVDQHQKRRAAAPGGERWIPQRACGGDDDQAGKRQPQQRQPPGRARRRFLLGRDCKQQTCRREIDATRPRRNEPQQPPKYGQAEQAEQHERLRKTQR
jgi:hypothetical protein